MERLTCLRCACAGLFIVAAQGAQANGIFENRSWSFRTSADRAADAYVLEVIERQKGGFYDSATINNNNTNTTNFYGDQFNCAVAPQATGSSAASVVDAVTSSPEVAPGGGFTANTTGNATDNQMSDSDGAFNNGQTNEGALNSDINNNTATAGNTDASGGHTDQVLNNTQTNSGSQTADVSNSQGCSFAGDGSDGTDGTVSSTGTQTLN